MIDKKSFKNAISVPFKEAGFISKGQSWYLNGKDAVIVTNLQKSNWSNSYYINVGVWLKALGDLVFPQYNNCHLGFRAEALFPEKRNLILVSCDLEKTNTELLTDLSGFIESLLIPFLRECSNANKLKEFMRQGLLDKGLVRIEAKQYLARE